MSKDVELIINHTSELFYQELPQNPMEQNYRLLDAPLTKYFIGIFRKVFNQQQLSSDWDWTKPWSENQSAFPSRTLLLTSRLSTAIFFPFSVIFFGLIMKDVFKNNISLLIVSVSMFAFNSLLLLHTRRAMAESVMIFFLLVCIYALAKIPKKWIFLVAFPMAFAMNAKQSLIFLIPIAVLIIIYYFRKQWKILGMQVFFFLVLLASIFFVLNPIMWEDPIKVSLQMLDRRSELSKKQVTAIESVTPEYITDSLPQKLTALVAQTFILQPTPQEISNYQNEINQSVLEYFNNPLHRGLIRNLTVGALYFLLFLFGFYKSFSFLNGKYKLILGGGFLFFCIEILFLLAIPFQRYYLPAIPYIIIFSMIGLAKIAEIFKNSSLYAPFRTGLSKILIGLCNSLR